MEKNIKKFALVFAGIITILLGLLWFLQGADLVHIKPLLCFANCEPITGGSLLWAIVGLIVFIIGAGIIYLNFRRSKKDKFN